MFTPRTKRQPKRLHIKATVAVAVRDNAAARLGHVRDNAAARLGHVCDNAAARLGHVRAISAPVSAPGAAGVRSRIPVHAMARRARLASSPSADRGCNVRGCRSTGAQYRVCLADVQDWRCAASAHAGHARRAQHRTLTEELPALPAPSAASTLHERPPCRLRS